MTGDAADWTRREATAALLSMAPAAGGAAKSLSVTPIRPTQASYAQACLVERPSRWLFISGQTPTDENGRAPDGFEAQAQLAWRNVEAQLRPAGMTFANLVKVSIFLADRRYREANTRVRKEVLGALTPALTVAIVDIFDEEWMLEIEAVGCD
jgi:enamine deaminase RidA (YjgF/YER057c/UK114 family)